MAWLYKQRGSNNFWLGFRVNGKQTLRSTGTDDEDKAKEELARVESMFQASKAKNLTSELYTQLTGRHLPSVTIKTAVETWLESVTVDCSAGTADRYRLVVEELLTHLDATDKGPSLAMVGTREVRGYLMAKRKSTSAMTANLSRKVLMTFFKFCIAEETIRDNPVEAVKRFEASKGEKHLRRAFTVDEVKSLWAKAPTPFWKYMIVGGFTTGLRLGDLIEAKVGNFDLVASTLKLRIRKTGQDMTVPLAPVFREYVAKCIPKGSKPADYLWPEQAQKYQERGSAAFSGVFWEMVMVKAGLTTSRRHVEASERTTDRRKSNPLSFHSLRHAFITELAARGNNSAVTKSLAGHSSDLVHDLYTHVPQTILAAAVAALPSPME